MKKKRGAVKEGPDPISSHEVFLLLLEDVQKPIQRDVEERQKKGTLKDKVSKVRHPVGEFYSINCFRQLSKLRDIPRRLRLSLKQMTEKPTEQFLRRAEISRTEYIEHHYSNFIFTLVSSRDVSLTAVDVVLNLGNSEKVINSRLILSNFWVRRFELLDVLKNLEKIIGRYSEDRNSLAHQGDVPKLSELDQIGLLDTADHLLQSVGKKALISEKLRHEMIDVAIHGAVTKLHADVEHLERSIVELLNKLCPVYKLWKRVPATMRSPEVTVTYERK